MRHHRTYPIVVLGVVIVLSGRGFAQQEEPETPVPPPAEATEATETTEAKKSEAPVAKPQEAEDERIVAFREAVRENPEDVRAHLDLGKALAEKGQAEAALAEYRRAVELDPKVAEAHLGLGDTLAAQGRLEEALEAFRTAARLGSTRPKDPEVVPATIPEAWIEALRWRCIGPANMGGRITAIAVNESDPSTWWAATASGGLLKTTNNGISFEHQFDREATVSIGDVAVSRSNPDIVWVGTGENNPRNSVSWGDGVYKSVDGGKTWAHMGLKESFQIGRIAMHPTDPDIVYVGALGRLWGSNEERGLFKTTDGGKTWERILYVDENTGVIDVQMHPHDPETLLVATYERQRDLFDTNDPSKRWGPGGGLHKTTDGGRTWKRITAGLPSGALGRMGLEYFRENPEVVFALVECERIGKRPEDGANLGASGEDADAGARLTEVVKDGPAAQAGLQVGDVLLAIDDVRILSYADLQRECGKRLAGDTVSVEVSRERVATTVELTFGRWPEPREQSEEGESEEGAERPAGGRSRRPPGGFPRRGGQRTHPYGTSLGGQEPNYQEHQGPGGHEYGGLYRSDDGGESWSRINSVNPRPMYFSQVRVDPSDDDHLFVLGISLYRSSDGGGKFTPDGGRGTHADHHALWIDPQDGRHMILGNDGGIYVTYDRGENWDHLNHAAIGQFYHATTDSRRDYRVYGGLQDNGSWGGPSRVGHNRGPTNADWIRVGGGDGFVCRVDANDPDQVYFESQNGGLGRLHLGNGERGSIRPRPPEGTRYRFNWNTPFILSHHNSRIYYTAGNYVFRSLDRGEGLRRISPEITKTDRGSATALAESPLDSDLLYVGTDDGALWVTRDGGQQWHDIFLPQAVDAGEIAAAGGGAEGAAEPQERPAGPPRGGGMLARMMERDANGDGKLQREELPERMAGLLDQADANKDGALDQAELEAMSQRFRGERGGFRGAGRGPRRERSSSRTPAVAAEPGGALGTLVPGPRYVSSLAPSRFEAERAYVTLDGHRSNDDAPYVFVTEDAGRTWSSLVANLPPDAGSVRTVAEDLVNPDLLFLGTEFAAWISIDRGASWTKFNGNLPTVAVHAFALHPNSGDVVAATHGRSLWIADVTTFRQITRETLAADAWLYRPNEVILWAYEPGRGGTNREYVGENPPSGAEVYYSLQGRAESVTLRVLDGAGKVVRELEAPSEPGLHRVSWDLRRTSRRGEEGRFGRGGFFRGRGSRAAPGTYQIELTVGERSLLQPLEVKGDPDRPAGGWSDQADDEGPEEETGGW